MVLSPATSPLEISVAYVLHLATLAESFGVPRDTLLRTLPEAALVPGPAPAVIRAEQLEETLARVEPAGGKVLSPVIDIPAGRFAYCTDPDGNSIGLFTFGS